MNLPDTQVKRAYAKSLAALEYIRDTFGMVEIRQMLKLMAAKTDFSSILQRELQLTYPAFEADVTASVARRFGSP